jgi:hypothetical protein
MTGANRNLTDHIGRLGQHVEVAGLGGGLEILRIEAETCIFLRELRGNAFSRQDVVVQRVVGQAVGQHANIMAAIGNRAIDCCKLRSRGDGCNTGVLGLGVFERRRQIEFSVIGAPRRRLTPWDSSVKPV